VTLEALLDSPYLARARDAGLVRGQVPAMAKFAVDYADARIGAIALAAQLWTDRHFSLDYALKGLHKTGTREERQLVTELRAQYRAASHDVLRLMIEALTVASEDADVHDELLAVLSARSDQFTAAARDHLLDSPDGTLPTRFRAVLAELEAVRASSSWQLINPVPATA
jgi:hypothetical protein